MGALKRLAALGRGLRREFRVYRAVLRDPRTPRLARLLLWLALGYVLLPFDLVPDFLPVVGHLDDLVVVPALVFVALRMVPPEVAAEARARGALDAPPD